MAKSIEPDVKTWFVKEMSEHETSFKQEQDALNAEIENALKTAKSKSSSDSEEGKGGNRPDFSMFVDDNTNMMHYPVMIEAKGIKDKLHKFEKDGSISLVKKVVKAYAVNGGCYYANALIDYAPSYDHVIAVGINGFDDDAGRHFECEIWYVSTDNLKIPKLLGSDISLLYKTNHEKLLKLIKESVLTDADREAITQATENNVSDLFKTLNQKLHDEWHIDNVNRIELVSGMVMAGLGIEGKVAPLDLGELRGLRGTETNDGKVFINRIRDFLSEKGLPQEKLRMVVNSLERVFINLNLQTPDAGGVSTLKYMYTFIQSELLPYLQLGQDLRVDFTGKFFNVLTDWMGLNGDVANDCVLTPRYITNLMAQLCRVDRNSYVWDYTTGTAGFLVSAMNLMLNDADMAYKQGIIEKVDELEVVKRNIRSKQLLGVELRPEMYLLGVLNMILMGDGISNILQENALHYDGTYKQGKLSGQNFPANVFLLNPPYSADGKGLVFVEKALEKMSRGYAAVIIQENAGSSQGNGYGKRILEHNSLIASIRMPPDLFTSSVQTAIYLFEVGVSHKVSDQVIFIDMSVDGYTRSKRKKASAESKLKDSDNAKERYAEVVDHILPKHRPKTKYYTEENGKLIVDTISLNGNDWTFNQHKKIDMTPTEEDFKKTVADYLAWKVSLILRGQVSADV